MFQFGNSYELQKNQGNLTEIQTFSSSRLAAERTCILRPRPHYSKVRKKFDQFQFKKKIKSSPLSIRDFFLLLTALATNSLNHTDPNNPNPFDRTVSDVPRPIRAPNADPLKTTIEKMKTIARIATGIFLQRALAQKTIMTDALISELLRLGSVTPADIIGINGTELTEALTALKDLPGTLTANSRAMRFAGVYKALHEVKKLVDGSGNITNWSEKRLKADIEKMAQNGIELKFVTQLDDCGTDWKSTYKSLSTMDYSEDSSAVFFSQLKKAADCYINGTNLVSADLKTVKFATIESATSELSPLSKAAKGVKKYSDTFETVEQKLSDTADFASFEEYFHSVFNASRKVDDITKYLEVIKNFSISRSLPPHSRHLNYTFGFPRGYDDLNLLSDDLNSQWISQVARVDSFKMGLRSVESLSPSLKDIESDLGSEQQRVAMKPFFKFAEEFRCVHLKSKNLIDNAEAIRNCHRFTPDQPNATDFMNVELDAKELDAGMERIRKSMSDIETNLTAAEAGIIMVRDICAKAEGKKGADLEKVFNEFRNNKDMNKTNDLLKKVSESLAIVKTVQRDSPIKVKAKDLSDKMSVILSYQKALKLFGTLFSCLQGVKDYASVMTFISNSEELKSDQSPFSVGKVQRILSDVAGTPDKLTALNDKMGSIDFKTAESNALELLEDPSTHSEVIGTATQGLVAMKMLLDKQSEFEQIPQHVGPIGQAVATTPPQLSSEDVIHLKSVVALSTNISTLFAELHTWSDQIVESDSTVLADYKNLFSNAATVAGIPAADVKAMSAAVANLKDLTTDPTARDELTKMAKWLDNLGLIGVDFSNFTASFASAPNSLDQLDAFFAAFAELMAPPLVVHTGPPPQSQQQQSVLANTTSGIWIPNTTETANSATLAWILGSLGGIVLIIVATSF
ncbi:unnamed protein product [Caenorhabditis sp. 36 PRJEB53466]|nr:unnamed protein product [Caenorhabditis sp. 36 PRJEB53466]